MFLQTSYQEIWDMKSTRSSQGVFLFTYRTPDPSQRAEAVHKMRKGKLFNAKSLWWKYLPRNRELTFKSRMNLRSLEFIFPTPWWKGLNSNCLFHWDQLLVSFVHFYHWLFNPKSLWIFFVILQYLINYTTTP